MVKKYRENTAYNENSIYHDLKEFHDRNKGVLYSYQDFDTAGIKEFKIITQKVRPLQDYEKSRLANKLVEIYLEALKNEENLITVKEYISINPIINYYDNFVKSFKSTLEGNVDLNMKLRGIISRMLFEGTDTEEVKLGILIAAICNFENISEILEVFSIHNEYLFYVIEAYEYIGNCNNTIFEMAKRSQGYGKVFILMHLRPATYEIRKWMIENGCENNVGTTELAAYSMLSLEMIEYLENTVFNKEGLEAFSKSFSTLLSDYGIDEVKDSVKLCNKLLEIIDKINGGIYSLYAVISIIYSIEAVIIDEYKSKNNSTQYKYNNEYKEIIDICKKICKKDIWHEVIANEIENIKIESSVLIGCAEKTKYKLKKKEFETILRRDYTNALLYKYAFSVGGRAIRKCAVNLGLDKLPMSKVLSGQDELKIDNLTYEDIAQICFFIIIKYFKYEEFKNEYKDINLQALKSPLIETRLQAALNLQIFKEEFDSLDKESINDAISTEMVMNVRRSLNSLLIEQNNKIKKYVTVNEEMHIEPHVKDVYLITFNVSGTSNFDMSEVYNRIFEDDILYLKRKTDDYEDQNSIEIITIDGYVIGYVPRESNVILKNLLDKGKYLYGKIKEISEDYNSIKLKIYLSYKDVVEEITSTLSLLSGEKELYLQ
ncbi:HIRAN domain-containing protein [Clostridium sp. DL-VIII]|uniref:HIRAN domain-containing protein n=1 Tax=Clostridium sp. DL-VIII TaxID=641107 RepID=UPI00023AFD09|nr:HIRAN domain-containing protein [Clostridium sp. DL-VIII]EHJ00208.1 HIRAN domain-containing protein [Clostridium sp. DL-VIII]